MKTDISQAIETINQGGIIIYPTDTAFGIGCRIDDSDAVQKLFSIRERPSNKATPVLFSSLEMVEDYVKAIPEDVRPLLKKYWPGALTVILPAVIQKVPSLVRGGGLGIGCRIPDHEIPLEIISALGIPIIGTSANFPGEPTPYKMADINPKLISLVDFMMPGTTNVQKESTVIDCTQKPWNVLRKGAIDI
jgi:L-threonylcarbamoyladenylate synthase